MNKGMTTGMFFLLCLMSGSGTTAEFQKQPQPINKHQFRPENQGEYRSQQYQAKPLQEKPYEAWGLTQKDWMVYQKLMQGTRGVLSPELDPITALGVEANSESERQRYAELHVKFERQRVEKELAFQRSVDAAWNRLYPNAQLIDMSKLKKGEQTPSSAAQTQGRLLFFTRIKQCPDCEQTLKTLLGQIRQGRQLDIFLVDAKTDDDIRAWARTHNIPTEKVMDRSITLNHDKGRLDMISQFTGQVPYLAVKTGHNRYQEINVH